LIAELQIWSLSQKRIIFTCQDLAIDTQAIAWTADGKHIVAGCHDGTVRLWNVFSQHAAPGTIYASYKENNEPLVVAIAPDGTKMAYGYEDHSVHIWDAATQRHLLTYFAHMDRVNALAWSPDGRYLASCGTSNDVHIWDASMGNTTHIYTGHKKEVNALAWSPGGQYIASASHDQTIHTWLMASP
jgi:WD40 repeat protein